MTPVALAELHARCFTVPRPWTKAEFDALRSDPKTLFFLKEHAVLVGRVTLDEAELLTLAVHPEHRRAGIARGLVLQYHVAAKDAGAASSFLEVAATNTAARALYRSIGYREVGCRPRYYRAPEGAAIDALLLRCDLVA